MAAYETNKVNIIYTDIYIQLYPLYNGFYIIWIVLCVCVCVCVCVCIHYLLCIYIYILYMGFPGDSIGKESACNAGGPVSIPGSERHLGEGNGNPLQDSYLENSMDREAWWATVHGVAKSRT